MCKLYEIPQFKNYHINTSGEVFSKFTNSWISGSVNPAGYHNYKLTRNDNISITVGRHRLMAMTFKPNPYDVSIDLLYVNHINGIKGDDRLDNIEWLFPKSNCEHAGTLGITPKCVPIQVKEYGNGSVQTFPSYIECSEYYNISKDFVSYWAAIGPYRVASNGLQFRTPPSDEA